MTLFTTVQTAVMQRALRAAAFPDTPPGPNPRISCVILSFDGSVLAEGRHHDTGSVHTEADILASLAATGTSARGTTILITLEPCNHQGRTGPCAQVFLDAGVVEVIYVQNDPTEQARGDAVTLEVEGARVRRGPCTQKAACLNRPWFLTVTRGRPMVAWRLVATLDGHIAAADGTSQWITPVTARHDAHRPHRQCNAIMVDTGTAPADDPAFTIRDKAGQPAPVHLQPLRVVVGSRSLPLTAKMLADGHYLLLSNRDPRAALAALAEREIRHALLGGGPTLTTTFLHTGLVDRVIAYTAPVFLDAELAALTDFGVTMITDALRLCHLHVEVLGTDDELIVRLYSDLETGDIPVAHIHTEESH